VSGGICWLTSRMVSTLEFTDDAAYFLAEAKAHLAAEPVVTTVIATVTARLAERPIGRDDDAPFHWWAIARDERGSVAGVVMRTAPFPPYPLYVLAMPDDAARLLAQTLHDRGEEVGGVNGALPAVRVFAEEYARLTGGEAAVHEHLRLFELGELSVPPAPPGRLRSATRDDAGLCLAWFRDFESAAAEQAGREGTHGIGESFTLEDMHARIDDGVIWLWVDEEGEPVHLTGANVPANGVTRVGPVYTPRQYRGRGYASRAVAEISRAYLEQGVRCCLFTDQANPTSNKIYEALGYRPVVDMANLVIG
jgi:GNAT superfamily N-acetyltransferase